MGLSLKRPGRFAARGPRKAVEIRTALLLPDDTEADVVIKNISAEGFMGEADCALPPEAQFGVSLPGYGIVRAVVRWTDETTVGAAFVRPVNLESFEEIG
ncbi:MAG TPA: hypothetical protein VF702_03415 [Allosphingosinicella sp.]